MTVPTVEQTQVLAQIEQAHGQVLRLQEGEDLSELVLKESLTDTRAYICKHCQHIFTIEPGGDVEVWGHSDESDDVA